MLKKFTYKKKDGSVSDRTVFITSLASDCDMGIDLTEFDDNEREYYLKNLKMLKEEYDEGIKQMGLWGNWRKFKVEGIQ